MRALIFYHADDPACWHIDDQDYLGDAFLVAPIINSEGVRDVYLPEGEWVDLWTGERRDKQPTSCLRGLQVSGRLVYVALNADSSPMEAGTKASDVQA